MLGGTIVRGEGIGRTLGYPTANIDCDEASVHLEPGVYASVAQLNNETYMAALVVMTRPWKVEAHLIGYAGPDIYGEYLVVRPKQRVSTLEKYDSREELKKKIAADLALVKKVFEDPE